MLLDRMVQKQKEIKLNFCNEFTISVFIIFYHSSLLLAWDQSLLEKPSINYVKLNFKYLFFNQMMHILFHQTIMIIFNEWSKVNLLIKRIFYLIFGNPTVFMFLKKLDSLFLFFVLFYRYSTCKVFKVIQREFLRTSVKWIFISFVNLMKLLKNLSRKIAFKLYFRCTCYTQ